MHVSKMPPGFAKPYSCTPAFSAALNGSAREYNYNGSELVVDVSDISSNHAGGDGGAIFAVIPVHYICV
jgi:hypothetical protein